MKAINSYHTFQVLSLFLKLEKNRFNFLSIGGGVGLNVAGLESHIDNGHVMTVCQSELGRTSC